MAGGSSVVAVVLGARGLQRGDPAPALRAVLLSALEQVAASDSVHLIGIDVDGGRPVPDCLADTTVPILSSGEFGPAPTRERPLAYHVGASGDADRLWDLIPRWAAAPDIVLSVNPLDTPGTAAPLLEMADVVGEVDAGFPERIAAAAACGRQPQARERLAIVTPLPPTRSGISYYSQRLIEALAQFVDVDVYRDDDSTDTPFDSGNVECHPASGFEWRWELAQPDHPPLYCIGNNRFHVQAWRSLMHREGDVLLHDVKLAGLYGMLVDEGTLTVKELDERIRLIEGAVPEVITSSDLMMIGEVIDHARRIYVHSNLGREMILRHRPLRAEDVHVVPFAMPPPRPRSATASPPVVAAFGHLQYGPVLVDAACLLARRREQVTVRLVGAGVRAGELDQLRDLVASRGLADRVLLLGWIDDETYHRELAGASVAIQLRVYSHGEMSASVIDCLAAGVPTVINEFGALSELPEDVAARVPAHPTVDQIVDAVEVLLDDEHAAARLAGSGQEFVRAHGADRAARGLLELIAGP